MDVRAALGLLVLATCVFDGALRGRTFAAGDIQPLLLGQLDAIVACVAQGSWPVWDPLFGFGQPLWANPGNQVLYPPTWLNVLVLPETYLTLYVVAHAFWAGLGTWALASRVLGFSGWAAWLSAAAWMASGPMLSLVQRWQHFAAVAWLPWVVIAALACLARPSARTTLGLAAALAMQWLAGSVEMAVSGVVLAACWGVASQRPAWPTAVRAWLPAGLLALAVTAAMWLPALELLHRSARSELVGNSRFLWSIHPWRWFELVAPLRPDEMLLRPEVREALLGPAGTIVPSMYLGAPLGGLVLLALARSPRRALVAGLGALALLCALGAMAPHVPALAWAADRVPASILRFPGKLTLLVAFAWALLAGLGLDAWRARTASPARGRGAARSFLAAGLPAAAFFLAASAFPGLLVRTLVPPPPQGARVWDAVSLDAAFCGAAALAVAVCAALSWLARGHPGRLPACVAAVVLVATADLAMPNRRVNLMVRPELVGRAPETAARLHADGAARVEIVENEPRGLDAGGRALPRRLELDPASRLAPHDALALGANISLAGRSASRWGLAGSMPLESLVAPTREQLELSRLFYAVAEREAALPLLQAGAVSHVLARLVVPGGLVPVATIPSPLAAPVRLLRVPNPLPRTYVVGRSVVGSDEDAVRFLLDPGAERDAVVVLAEGPSLAGSPGFAGTSRVLDWRPDELRLEVEATSDAVLVLVEAYDPGWIAAIDGQAARVHRANFGFRAVAIPSGQHSVSLRYRPRAVSVGLAVSAVALAGAGLVLLRHRSGRNPSAAAAQEPSRRARDRIRSSS